MVLAGVAKSKTLLILGFVFFTFVFWWCLLNFTSVNVLRDPDLFADTYAFTALIGGLFGWYIAITKWGGWKSIMGKVILLLSFGLLAQVFGQFAYAFYARFLGVEVPYPSIGDIGFYGSMFLYIFGSFYLIRLCTGPSRVRNTSIVGLHPVVVVVPATMLVISYLFFIRDYVFDTENILITIMDFAAPLLQAFYISLALVAFYFSKNIVNGIMHKKILFLLFALFAQYSADFIFLYKAHREIYQPAGVTDLVYLIAYFLMSLSIINLDIAFEQIKKGK